VVGRLIGAREGAALRRVSYEACSVSLATYLASNKAAPLRRAGVATMSAVLKDLWTVRQAEIAKKGGSHGVRGWPESSAARVIREREEKTQRKAVTVIVLGHLKKLWCNGPRGMVLLAMLGATALRMSVLAVLYATVGAAGEWLQRARRAVWRLITAPAHVLTKATASMTSDVDVNVASSSQADDAAYTRNADADADADADNDNGVDAPNTSRMKSSDAAGNGATT